MLLGRVRFDFSVCDGLTKVFVFITLLETVSAGLFDNLCNTTQICHNCYISTMGEFGCVQTLTSMFGSLSEKQCIEEMWRDKSLLGVDYDPATKRCRGYYCDYGLGYHSGRTVYRKTCEIDCFELTLTKDTGQMIALTETYDNYTDDKSYLHTCFKWACESTPYLCAASFDSVTHYCYKFTSCAPYCRTVGNSTWEVITKVCHDEIDCGPPIVIPNGLVMFNGTMFSYTAYYGCNEGFEPQNASTDIYTKTCDMYGNWTGMVPVCRPVDCGSPDDLGNGSLAKISGTLFGNSVTYACDLGFTLTGQQNVSCEASGKWSDDRPVCEPVDCGVLPDPENGRLIYKSDTTFYGDTVIYECEDNFTLTGNDTRVCDADGQWNGTDAVCKLPDCGDLSDPLNGRVNITSGTTFKCEALYSCHIGYELMGYGRRICQSNGSWEYSAPECIIKDCGAPVAPGNGSVVTPYGTKYGRLAISSCLRGFTLTSSVYRTCLATGFWSEPSASCTEVLITTTTPQPPQLNYIMPCNCIHNNKTNVNITQEDEEDIVYSLIQSTQINVWNTTRYVYRRRSRVDPRTSSTLIGYGCVGFMCLIFGFMFCLDVITVYQQGHICNRRFAKYCK